MGLSEYCKIQSMGTLTVSTVLTETGLSRTTLYRWYRTRTKLIKIIVSGIIQKTRYLKC